SGPGGVATLLLLHRGRREALVSAGAMPAAADPTHVTADDLKGGPRAIGVPGLVAAVLGLHERHGTLPRARVLAPAIRLAEDGFRGHEVCVPPPPTNAIQALQTLQILEGFDLSTMGHNSIEYLHHFIEAAKIASADRVGFSVLGPGAPIAGLLSPRYAAERRK